MCCGTKGIDNMMTKKNVFYHRPYTKVYGFYGKTRIRFFFRSILGICFHRSLKNNVTILKLLVKKNNNIYMYIYINNNNMVLIPNQLKKRTNTL